MVRGAARARTPRGAPCQRAGLPHEPDGTGTRRGAACTQRTPKGTTTRGGAVPSSAQDFSPCHATSCAAYLFLRGGRHHLDDDAEQDEGKVEASDSGGVRLQAPAARYETHHKVASQMCCRGGGLCPPAPWLQGFVRMPHAPGATERGGRGNRRRRRRHGHADEASTPHRASAPLATGLASLASAAAYAQHTAQRRRGVKGRSTAETSGQSLVTLMAGVKSGENHFKMAAPPINVTGTGGEKEGVVSSTRDTV